MDKYIGKKLEGRYEIQALIGMGGMSNVYKAFDAIDERTVAVKILRDEFLDNAEFLRMFKNESKAIAVLSHPNIVRVYDVSFTNHIHSIVMEYIDGITMKDYIERQGMLGWKEAVHFTLQILRALQHAHDKGIVHRDIKPHNIMLLHNGEIKVMDFGIARFARSEVRTITDRAIGSVHYISPEQAMGDNTDEKSDIYSLGVMLFEMLTGRLPFDADTAVSVAIKQIQTQAARPRSINPDIPEGLEEITMRAMQKDAARRYQSAAEMIADIERFKQDPSILFAYKYMDAENDKSRQKKYARAINKTREEDNQLPPRKKTPYIPILTGVTLAFVLAAMSFIGLMVYYNNPFKQVDDTTVPNLVGLR
ncbi:MAG: protein kinase, partial [Oscillospiraceae bacterium]|nr:protein kinase [Oscillospiraceae bacterium]